MKHALCQTTRAAFSRRPIAERSPSVGHCLICSRYARSVLRCACHSATVPRVGHCAHTGNEIVTVREENTILGRRSLYAIGPLSCLSVCLSVTLVYCGQTPQTVGRIKMKLGMQVGLGPGHIVLDGDPAPLPKRAHSPHAIFGRYLLRPNGCNRCMDQDATWYGARPRPQPR